MDKCNCGQCIECRVGIIEDDIDRLMRISRKTIDFQAARIKLLERRLAMVQGVNARIKAEQIDRDEVVLSKDQSIILKTEYGVRISVCERDGEIELMSPTTGVVWTAGVYNENAENE